MVPCNSYDIARTFFYAANNFSSFYLHDSLPLKILSPLSYVCYIGTYLFIPDGGDTGETRAIFNLIEGDIAWELWKLVPVFLVGTLGCLIAQTVLILRAFNAEKKKNAPQIPEVQTE